MRVLGAGCHSPLPVVQFAVGSPFLSPSPAVPWDKRVKAAGPASLRLLQGGVSDLSLKLRAESGDAECLGSLFGLWEFERC